MKGSGFKGKGKAKGEAMLIENANKFTFPPLAAVGPAQTSWQEDAYSSWEGQPEEQREAI